MLIEKPGGGRGVGDTGKKTTLNFFRRGGDGEPKKAVVFQDFIRGGGSLLSRSPESETRKKNSAWEKINPGPRPGSFSGHLRG